jgi:hypothetical protein
MSTGLNCEFVNVEDKGWYYILEHGNAPKNAWDWREYASAYGPFTSEEQAQTHLHNNHANPGGWSSGEVSKEQLKGDKTLQDLLKDARIGNPTFSYRPRFRY